MLQAFKEEGPRAEKWDWQEEIIDKVHAWFSGDAIWKTYFEPIIAKLWK